MCKQELRNGEITDPEYLKWKINCPTFSSSVDKKGNDKSDNSYSIKSNERLNSK